MSSQYWLVKQEPEAYSWANFVKDGRTAWTGVRSFPARLNLRAMKAGDGVFFYHSVSDKQVMGLARVVREAYPDPTATEGDWSAVDLVPDFALPQPVPLEVIRTDAVLQNLALIRQSRLSVMPVSTDQHQRLLALGGIVAPARGNRRK